MMTPSVGRAVHYVGRDRTGQWTCQAATITEVGADPHVGLAVATPHGMIFEPLDTGGSRFFDKNNLAAGVVFDGSAPGVPGTWHWPERV